MIQREFHGRKCHAFRAYKRAGASVHVNEFNIGAAPTVQSRIAPHRDTGRGRLNDENGQPEWAGAFAAGARKYKQVIGDGRIQYGDLCAIERPSIAVALGRALNIAGFKAGRRLAAGKRENHVPRRNRGQKCGALQIRCAGRDEFSAQHCGTEVGLQHQPAADRLHHGHTLFDAAAQAAR